MQDTPTASEKANVLDLTRLRVEFSLPPSIARRLRATAADAGRSVEREASLRLAASLVPDVRERARLTRRDLADIGLA